jgi:hypothetical protein
MRKLFVLVAAAATLGFAAPAAAQVVIRGGDDGVKVRVGGHDRGYHRGHYYRGHYARERCRVVKTRTVTPGGRVIIKTRRTCR